MTAARPSVQAAPLVSAPGAREPLVMSLIGISGGPWAVVDSDGNTVALGIGDHLRQAMDAMIRLAALGVQHAPPGAVKDALAAAAAERRRITGT